MLFVEVGNSTFKLARLSAAGEFIIERLDDPEELSDRLFRRPGPVAIAPVAEKKALEIFPLFAELEDLRVVERHAFLPFISDSYDTPETLGLDRILNLFALDRDGLVISCGTAITIDAVVDERPCWGAIMPGFRTAAWGLAQHAPALPIVSGNDLGELPARTSRESVANGVILGTALAASALAALLAERSSLSSDAPIIFTGGDAELMAELLQSERTREIRPALLFEGMAAKLKA